MGLGEIRMSESIPEYMEEVGKRNREIDQLASQLEIAVKGLEKISNHDWRYLYLAPLREALYQRQEKNQWLLIKTGLGFA